MSLPIYTAMIDLSLPPHNQKKKKKKTNKQTNKMCSEEKGNHSRIQVITVL